MTDQPTDPKLITAELLAKHLRDLPRLEEEFERAKHALIGGEYPVSEETYEAWLDEFEITEEEAAVNPAFKRYDSAASEYHSTSNYLLHIVPHYFQQHAIEQVADRFPSLQGVPGVFEMDESKVLEWMDQEACPQGLHAAKFIFSLWKNDPASFNVADAFAVWDDKHQEAYMQWLRQPVVPQELLWGQF